MSWTAVRLDPVVLIGLLLVSTVHDVKMIMKERCSTNQPM